MKIKEKEIAVAFRKKGYSISEISDKLKVAKSTVSIWVKEVVLSKNAQKRLQSRWNNGVRKSRITSINKRLKRDLCEYEKASYIISKTKFDSFQQAVLCSLIFWCEGSKSDNESLSFINSDPDLISLFLKLLRENFDIDESRMRICMYLHQYHDKLAQLRFWSIVTKVPEENFFKIHIKSNTGKNIHKNYQGCISVRYYDIALARRLRYIAKGYMKGPIG